jgi:hypothetical protein
MVSLCLMAMKLFAYRVHVAHIASIYKPTRLQRCNLRGSMGSRNFDRIENVRESLILSRT